MGGGRLVLRVLVVDLDLDVSLGLHLVDQGLIRRESEFELFSLLSWYLG